MKKILLVSDDVKSFSQVFKSVNMPGPYDQKNINIGTDIVNPLKYDIAFIDLDVDKWERKIIELRSRMPVIAFSEPNIRKAVEAMKLGASEYLEKPLEPEILGEVLLKYKKRILDKEFGFGETIGISSVMQEVYGTIKKAAASESNVLITGESGTGKELVARAIHKWSPRSGKSFITINCSAIPDTLLESELFGFEKGAFTGANYTKKGLIELADGGTVFFDEIGDVSALFQVKILRLIQEGEIMRIGGKYPFKVDIRFIAATNKDLVTLCKKGLFREDLFYRLNVININLPPLRNRLEDIPYLVEHFIKKHAYKRRDMLVKGISEEALDILKTYVYPGNIRELENIVERAISFANGPEILPSDLPDYILKTPTQKFMKTLKLKEALADVEKEIIWNALQKSGGNITRAAKELGIHRQQLQRKLKKLK
jgi:DNA-binding NtrC family response regulator